MKSIIKDINFYFLYLERKEKGNVGFGYTTPPPPSEEKSIPKNRYKKVKALRLMKKAEE